MKNYGVTNDSRCPIRRIARLMGLVCFLASVLLVQARGSAFSQNQQVTLHLRQCNVEEFLSEVKRQTGIHFMYKNEYVRDIPRFDVKAEQREVMELLDEVFADKGIRCMYDNGVVVLNRRLNDVKKEDAVIRGTVRSRSGDLLPGVTIIIKGTSVGVASDKNGAFSLNSMGRDTVELVFSFVGMKTREVRWTGEPMLNVVMEDEVAEIDEVVVTGYQKIDKRLSASSTYSVKAIDVMQPGRSSIDEMLQGEIPGLMVVNTSGSPSALPKMRMRGTATLLGNAAPVWVIDGVLREDPVNIANEDVAAALDMTNPNYLMFGNAISGLNPMDIESITFLKDASATAIYGTRAANGVIVVTTKKGKAGSTSINYSGTLTVKQRPSYKRSTDVMNSRERMALSKEFFEDGLVFKSTPKYGFEKAMIDYLENKIPFSEVERVYREREALNTDWFDLLFSNSLSQTHSLSVSGGNNSTSYYVSLSYNDDKGTADGERVRRYTMNLRVETALARWLDADMKVEYSERKVDGFNNVNPMDYAMTTARTLYPDERYIRSTNYVSEEIKEGEFAGNYTFNYDLTYNIFTELEETSNVGKTDELGATLMLRGDITSFLKFDALASYRKTAAFTERTATDRSYYMASLRGYDYGSVDPGSVNEKLSPYPYGGKLDRDEENSSSWTANFRLNFSKYWDEIHSLNAMLGGEMSSRKQTGFQTSEFGYFPDRGKTIYYEYNQPDAGNLAENYGDSYSKHSVKLVDRVDNKMSLFATLAYGWKNRYVLNANFRVDASSRFGENTNNRFLPIWSVAGRWNVTEENWMKGQEIVNDLALKLSYGSQGNVVNTVGPELIASYPNKPVDETVGEYFLKLKSLPYPDLRWEKTHTINVGLEFSLLKGKISGSAEYYKKKGKELLYTLEVPMELGIDAAYQNGADIVNEGLDVYLSITPVRTNDWQWSVSPVFSLNRDKIRRKTENRSYSDYIDGTVVLNDYPVGGFWSWRYKGLTHEEGIPVFDYDGGMGYTNAEMKEDPTKFLVYSGRTNPIMTGGLTTRLTWRQFMLRASFAYNLGAKVRIRPVYSSSLALNVPEYYENVPSQFVTHWRKPGDEAFTDNPGFLRPGKSAMYDHPGGSESFYTMWDNSDFRVVSGDFLRCRTISLSYTLPRSLVSKWGMKGMMLEVSGNDLFLVKSSKLSKQDPETSSTAIPQLPSYNFTLNISL